MDYSIGWNLSNTFLKGTDKQPLQIQIYHEGKQFRLGVKIHLSKAEYQQVTSGKFIRDMELQKVKRKMNEAEQKAKTILNDLKIINKDNFSGLFFAEIDAVKPKSIKYLKDVFADTIEEYKRLNKSVASYELAITSFTKFSGEVKLTNTDAAWINKYKSWMVENGRAVATANLYLRCLKVVWNMQIKRGIIHAKYYPFKDVKIGTSRRKKKALLPDEVAILWAYTPTTELEAKVKDYWFFCYFCNGMNPADALRLKYKNVKGNELTFIRHKTKNSDSIVDITVSLIPETLQIIDKYATSKRLPNEYLFPELRSSATQLNVEKCIINTRNYLNKRLKRIGKKLALRETPLLGNSRHSFATNLLLSGNKAHATEMLGHTNTNTTEHYFATLPAEHRKKITESLVPKIFTQNSL